MEIILKAILVILVFLAVSSGITKIMLMPQDVEFFGSYGFTNTILILYGISQLIGGILMAIKKTRFLGSVLVATTFLISAVVLIVAGNISLAITTFVAIFMLGIIMKQSLNKQTIGVT